MIHGQVEYYENDSPTLLQAYTDAALGRGLMNRRSVVSTIPCFNCTVITWCTGGSIV